MIEHLLVHTCTISRQGSGLNASNEDNAAYANVATGVRCRRSAMSEQETAAPTMAAVQLHKIFFAYGQDVQQRDRIVSLVNQANVTLIALAEVESVNSDPGGVQNHCEVVVREVTSA